MPPRELTRGDAVQGVVYLPHGLEESVLRGDKTVNVGFFADDSNTAQNGELYNVINEVIATVGAEAAVSRAGGVSSLGKNENETAAAMSPLRAVFRYLTNPTGQAATGTVVNFLFFFSMMYQGMTCLMLVGRLRVSKAWDTEVLSGSAAALMVRVVPYSLILTAAVGTTLAVLVNLGQLRFLGNPFLFSRSFSSRASRTVSSRCSFPGAARTRAGVRAS